MHVIARTRSKDQEQEKLRAAKDNWNLQVKQLIALLIPFKQGINGRGNSKIGVPPSNIKDPLPPQLGHYLSEISSRYAKVVEDAQKIIDAQAYYSAHRRKSQPKANISGAPQPASTVHANLELGLISEASWAGSRSWAKLSLLRKIDVQNRRLRLEMLGSGSDIYRDFKNFESEILNHRDPNSIPNAVRVLAALSSDFLSVFLRDYDKLVVIYAALGPQVKAQEPEEPQESVSPAKEEIPKSNVEIWENFKDIYGQLVKIEVVVKYLSTEENLNKYNTQALKELFDTFLRDLTVLYELTKRSDHGKSGVELERLAMDVVTKYQQLLQLACQALGPAKDFDELATRIPNPTVTAYQEIVEGQEQIRKLAAGAVTRWLRKNWLSLNPNNLDRRRIEMSETSVRCRKQLDHLMDLLEDREIGIKDIAKQNAVFCKLLVDLVDQAVDMSKSHMIAHKTKDYATISVADLRILREVKQAIENYTKSGK